MHPQSLLYISLLIAGISAAATPGNKNHQKLPVDLPICCPGVITPICEEYNIGLCPESETQLVPDPAAEAVAPLVCTPNLQPCRMDNAGACCSQCCFTNNGGETAFCCDI
ncbi:hypothetical protein K440DRAFT_610701 [Wilcoxina mikolae CBS 423.85]|nr:hypothetical protein K440DRAFT_610701 [Wilcoxina mikolae CBS 423.85]